MNKFCEMWNFILNQKDQLGIILTAIGLFIAWRGIQNWKKQLDGTSKVKLAKSLLSKVYHIRDLFRHARINVFFANEYPVEQGLNKKEEVSYIMRNRLKPLIEKMSLFEDEFYQAYVEWGDSSSKYLKDLRKLYFDFLHSVDTYVQYYDEKELTDDFYKEAKDTVFDYGENKFEDRLQDTVKALDKFFRPKYLGLIKYWIWRLKNYATQQ